MRLAATTAISLLVTGIGATIAYAYYSTVFLVVVLVAIVFTFVGPRSGAKADKVVQKTTLQMTNGTAEITRGGTGEPDALTFRGTLTVKKSKPAVTSPPSLSDFSMSFPVAKTNSKETKGSLKAGNEQLVNFRSSIDNLLTLAATVETPGIATKTRKDFVGGMVQSSDSKQSGSVKVDTKTFTRLAGKISLKGNAFVTSGPNNGYNGKYKIKVKFKPRKADF